MNIEFTKSFDKAYASLTKELQAQSKEAIAEFIDSYTSKKFPKSLRIHKTGPFISISITMNYRIFISPIENGIKFVFVGNHKDADNYLKK